MVQAKQGTNMKQAASYQIRCDEKDWDNQGEDGEMNWRCNGVLSLVREEK
jgi:hypothetical protein